MRTTRFVLGALFFAVLGVVLFIAARAAAFALPVQDFAQYWAAAHVITKNPYSFQLITEFERSCRNLQVASPMVMRNPPWSLVFALPFRLLTYEYE